MSLYNKLMGENEKAEELLDMLGLDKEIFGRYRDCYLNADGTEIIVYTRCGGDNREDFDNIFAYMREHKYFIEDYDDSYDETYCYFRFKTPPVFLEQTKLMATGIEPKTVGEKFEEEIKAMQIPGSEAAKRAEEMAKELQKSMEANPDGDIIHL